MNASLMLGTHGKEGRHEDDFYATNPIALELFLAHHPKMNLRVWECACGQGHLSRVLKDKGFVVKSTDLIDRGYGESGVDFLMTDPNYEWSGDILTNPPFKLAEKFIEKGMEILQDGNQLILFLKIQFLEGIKRYDLFAKYPPKYVYCHSSRQQCVKDGEFEKYTATTQFYAWYVWEKGYKGDTIIRWIK